MELTGQYNRFRRIGLVTKIEKEKGVAGNGAIQSCLLITAFPLSASHQNQARIVTHPPNTMTIRKAINVKGCEISLIKCAP
ncbi:hypothetical protein SAMN02746098_00717 [Desulfosporosinus lacus DSM 15449]|uniref:Uncharacterized protein n=1 Tax=Desulfosporosinus lacus DSM 15449 TaxID=1121420 RepID=A0A1M5S151_9FIRM|nr:hypothetical protein SAMN02746098_00717 [Desulfosporosinus lacus DSM 15449]